MNNLPKNILFFINFIENLESKKYSNRNLNLKTG
jgi:hypothetical protein